MVMARTQSSSIVFRMSKFFIKNTSLGFPLISSRWDLPWQFCVNIRPASEMQYRGSTSDTVYVITVKAVLVPKRVECLEKGWKWKSGPNHLAYCQQQPPVQSSLLHSLEFITNWFGHTHFCYYFLLFWDAWVKTPISKKHLKNPSFCYLACAWF